MLPPTHRQFGIEPHSTFQIYTAFVPGDSTEIEQKAIDWSTNTTKAES